MIFCFSFKKVLTFLLVTVVLLLVQAYSVFAQEGNNGEVIGIGTDPGVGIGECGYDIDYNWQWCPTGGTAISIGRFNELVRNTKTTVNGVTTPDRILTGTNIFP